MSGLAELRRNRGFSQRSLAEAAGVAPSTIFMLERGDHSANPTTVKKLADAMGVDVREVLAALEAPKAETPPRSRSEATGEAGFSLGQLEDVYRRHAEQAERISELAPEHAQTLVEAAFLTLMEVRRYHAESPEGKWLDADYARLVIRMLDELPESNVVAADFKARLARTA